MSPLQPLLYRSFAIVLPLAGQRSTLSVCEAAAIIVKACRYHLQAFYGVPEGDAIERGVRFSREAEEAWKVGGGRLASTLNYALVRGEPESMTTQEHRTPFAGVTAVSASTRIGRVKLH